MPYKQSDCGVAWVPRAQNAGSGDTQRRRSIGGPKRVQHWSDLERQRGKRTRPKAARLVPEQVDEGTTERIFDSESDEQVVPGRHFAGDDDDPNALLAANEDVLLDLTDGHVPLIRYEWRNQAGETMVVEAAWPFDSPQSAEFGAPQIRRSDSYDRRQPRDTGNHGHKPHERMAHHPR